MSTNEPKLDIEQPVESFPLARKEATVWELATIVAGSRDFPDCRTPEKAAVRILAGREMGVGPIASVIGIRVQNGRVSMDATLMAGCIDRSTKYAFVIIVHDENHCELHFYKDGASMGPSIFSMDDAKKASLDKKETWKNYPRNMLFARALSNGARWYCAGIFGGSVYTHEEIGMAVDKEGRAIEATSGEGNELCTRDHRQAIYRLVEKCGDSMPKFLSDMGVSLLDEISQGEAAKIIKNLEKKLAKKGLVATASELPRLIPSDPPAGNGEPLTPAQQTIADAYAESAKPSRSYQHDRIIELASELVPDESECREMLRNALAKRGKKKLAELDFLSANAIIESLLAYIQIRDDETGKDQPPFDPTPAPGK